MFLTLFHISLYGSGEENIMNGRIRMNILTVGLLRYVEEKNIRID